MITNVLNLNKMIKKYRLLFDSGDENAFRVHIGDKIVKFPDNGDWLYINNSDTKFFRKVDEDNKRNIIEG